MKHEDIIFLKKKSIIVPFDQQEKKKRSRASISLMPCTFINFGFGFVGR